MDGLFDDLVPKQVYGPGAAESGQQATPAQQAYAEAASHLRDPQAAPGTAANPSFDTPTQAGAPASYHVNAQGQLNDPNPQVSMGIFDDLLPGGPVQPVGNIPLGLYKGIVQPLDRGAQGMEFLAGKLGLPVDAIDKATMGSATDAAQGHQDFLSGLAAKGIVPDKGATFVGNTLAVGAMPGGPVTQGALGGALLSDKTDPMGIAGDAVKGAIGGKIAHTVVGAISGAISPKIAPNVQTLLDAKIPLTPGQITGGSLQRVEDAATSIPIFGDVVAGAKLRSIKALNLAVANRALAPIGESVPAGVAAGRESIAHAGDTLSDHYNALLPGLTIQPDQQFGQNLASLGQQAAVNLSGDHMKQLGATIKSEIIDKIDPATGQIPPKAMQDAETTLGLKIGRYGKSPMPADQNLADALTSTREMLRDLVARNNPQAAPELTALRTGWANLVIGENAAASLGAHEGLFTPAQLAGAVKKSDNSVRSRAYARGTALMQDLSDAALDRLPSKVPDSGSPLRHAVEGVVALGVGKESGMPIVGRAGMVGTLLSAPYTQAGGKIAQSLLAGQRPAVAPHIAAILNSIKPIARSATVAAIPAFTATNGYAPQ